MWFKVGLCSLGTSRKMFHCEIGELHMWYKGTLISNPSQAAWMSVRGAAKGD